MKHHIRLTAVAVACVLILSLSSCILERQSNQMEGSTTTIEHTIISQPEVGSQILYGNLEVIEAENAIYHIRSNGFPSSKLWTMIRIQEYPQNPPSTELTVPYETEENGKIPYVALQYDLSLSFIKTLRFSEGIQGIDLSKLPRINAPNLQEICLPSTLTALIGFPYEEDSSLWLTTPMMMTSTFPSGDFPELQAIHVASDNPIFQSEDGILYQNEHLVCIPQNYQSESGTVTVREGTLDLHIGAVNDCRHIRRLVIPDSVIDLQVDAITATAEHPLTVVCSKGSVAAEYVAQFGTQYHLTVEYTD